MADASVNNSGSSGNSGNNGHSVRDPIDLGSEPGISTFRLNGKDFECFPLDEIDIINETAASLDPPASEGERFIAVIQKRLKDRHGITASLNKSSDWYNALHLENERQKDFFDESPVSSDAMGSSQGQESGEMAQIPMVIINPTIPKKPVSRSRKSGSSKSSKTPSKRKK